MIILLKAGATAEQADVILKQIEAHGLQPLYMPGVERTVIGAIGDERLLGELHLENHPLVERLTPILTPYKLVSREAHPEPQPIRLGNMLVGGQRLAIIAGPCAVESAQQMHASAIAAQQGGAHALRGGAFKPRTSPYSFQGMGEQGLKLLQAAGRATALPVVTEVVEVADVALVTDYADAFQVGARNMQNYRLLKALGQSRKPVILKRGMAATVEDLLMSAEYIVSEGNGNVILCERGIRTFETATRNTLDLNAIPYLKAHTYLPVLVDPSHGTGKRDYVIAMSKAAIACGADGLLLEVHNDPANALSDGCQSLDPQMFAQLMRELQPFAAAAGRSL